MSRPLKFRAWDKHRKQMVIDFVLAPTSPDWGAFVIRKSDEYNKAINDIDNKNGDPLGGDYTVTDWGDYYALSNYEVMQFTGLQLNGVDLYEGDVIRFTMIDEGIEYGVIRFSKDGFWTTQEEKHHEELLSDELDSKSINPELAGNIYENPELLNP